MSDNQTQKNLPIEMSDKLIFDDMFSTMRERFIKEMERIDQEMNKLSANIIRIFGSNSTVQSEESESSQSNWQNITTSPLVVGEGENRKMKLQFDVSYFEPSEVQVNIVNNKLMVLAKQEKKTDNSMISKQYYREFIFPPSVDPATIVSSLSKDGVLTVESPLPALEFNKSN